MKKFLLLLLIIPYIAFASNTKYYNPPQVLSSSYSADSFSSLANPVFTQGYNYPFLAYSFVKNSSNYDHFALVNILDFDFIYSNYNLSSDDGVLREKVSLYSINRGFLFNNSFGIGIGYTTTSSTYEALDSNRIWHVGFLLRPFSFLSFGVVLRDYRDKSAVVKNFETATYSVALRPFGENLTWTADATFFSKDLDFDNYYSFGFEAIVYSGIAFTAKYDSDKNFSFGLSSPFSFRKERPLILSLNANGGKNHRDEQGFSSGGFAFILSRDDNAIRFYDREKFLYLRLNGNFAEENPQQQFIMIRERNFHSLIDGLRCAANDESINGLVIDIDSVAFGFAQIQELRRELIILRKRGKRVIALLNYSGNKEYYLATAADKIYFTPNSTFAITGLKMQAYFFKGLMDKAGVKYESVSKGRYKSFNEQFTRENMSDAARENLKELLEDLNNQYVSDIVESRKITEDSVKELFAAGFYEPATAKAKGFVDEVMHRDSVTESMAEAVDFVKFEHYIEEYQKVRSWGAIPEIAVIHVTGSIVSGEGAANSFSTTTGDYDYRESLNRAFMDDNIKGVVIRIDSGGGSAAASDFMWNYLLVMKKRFPKPVVFSFGNMAASGGYYISCTGDRIFAEKGTITGSIGVVAGKVSLARLYSMIGISTETIKMSDFADIFSESRDLTPKEKELFQKNIDFIYDRFTERVIEARGISKEDISSVAEGKIHSGKAARENKLVDENKGLLAAIEYVRNLSGIESSYQVRHLPERGSYLQRIIKKSEESVLSDIKPLLKIIQRYNIPDEKVLYITPYIIEIE
ncbi:MAG TPA: signal peptide peptidase SppA [Spirochaetota bacterium]|nr:signal peptide peptidase SppA [Spirochaetota bacterium]